MPQEINVSAPKTSSFQLLNTTTVSFIQLYYRRFAGATTVLLNTRDTSDNNNNHSSYYHHHLKFNQFIFYSFCLHLSVVKKNQVSSYHLGQKTSTYYGAIMLTHAVSAFFFFRTWHHEACVLF